MTKAQLLEIIKKHIQEVEESTPKDEAVEYATAFFKNNHYNTPLVLVKMNPIKLFATAISLKFNLAPLEVEEALLNIKDLFINITPDNFTNFVDDWDTPLKLKIAIEKIPANIQSPLAIFAMDAAVEILNTEIKKLYAKYGASHLPVESFYPFISLLYTINKMTVEKSRLKEASGEKDAAAAADADADYVGRTTNICFKLYFLRQSFEEFKRQNRSDEVSMYDIKNKISYTVKRGDYKNLLKVFNTSDIEWFNNYISEILKEYQTRAASHETKEKQKTKALRTYIALASYISSLDEKREVTSYQKMLSRLTDEDLKRAFLEYIYGLNLKNHLALEEEASALAAQENNALRLVFAKYGLPVNKAFLSSLTLEKEELDTSLGNLLRMQIDDTALILEIISKTTKSTIDDIVRLYDAKIVDSSFLNSHPIVFAKDSSSHENVMANAKTFQDFGLTPSTIRGTQDALLGEQETVKDSLLSLKSADLLDSLDPDTSLAFLKKDSLPETISMAISLGHREDIKEDLGLLNAPLERWKRVKLLHAISENVDKKDLTEALTTKEFIVPDAKIDYYLASLVPQESNDKEKPQEFIKTETSSTK